MPLYKTSFVALALSSPYTPLLISLATEDDLLHLSKISRSKSKISSRSAPKSFSFISGVSGTSLLNAVNLIAYNVFYTSIPVSVSLVDKDLSEGTVMQHPQILYYCQAGREDAVGKLTKEDGHKGIVYELPRTLGYFDDHNFTKRSDVENAERAGEAQYSLIEPVETSDEDSVVDDHSSSYSFIDHWIYIDSYYLREQSVRKGVKLACS